MPDLTGQEQLIREMIASRFLAGDSVTALAWDYDLTGIKVEAELRAAWLEERAKRRRKKA